jgi:carboxymethylenebutenolidase
MTDILEPIQAAIAPLSRRGFAFTTLAAGFAAAVQPVSAETITTDDKGLKVGEVKIPVSTGKIPAYFARPDKRGTFPVILVVQEIFGVHEHIKDLCRRFAKVGYLAVAPSLYARQGNPAIVDNIQDLIKDIVSKVPDAQVMSDLDATVAWAKKEGMGDTNRLAITGFCWGGRITWMYAAHNPNVKAGGAWYGSVVGKADEMRPTHPVDVAAKIKGAVLGLYGGKDQGIPLDTLDKMRDAIKAAGGSSQIIVYPEAPHGFNADYRPSYRPDEAKEAWAKLLAWFAAHGVAA